MQDRLTSRTEVLAFLASLLHGSGIEFGAGAYPFPVRDSCKVRYAEKNSRADFDRREYFGDSAPIEPDIEADITDMAGIEDDSLDFIIASHVIEHTPNPIAALQSANRRLKNGGVLALVIPDRDATFDRLRPLTSWDHLLADYLHPSKDRDFEHYLEFFRLCFPQEKYVDSAQGVWELGDDIHFHTWTFDSFGSLIASIAEQLDCRWSSVWSHPRASEADIEFYYALMK